MQKKRITKINKQAIDRKLDTQTRRNCNRNKKDQRRKPKYNNEEIREGGGGRSKEKK
jgi:hypothetical protein